MSTEPLQPASLPPRGNPLQKYFRQPSIYFPLPSGGRWWTDGSLEMPETGEVAVYPMTSKDEIIIRTPDALINGQGMVEVIQSCIPAIKDAWRMPAVDVDAALIAMRIASYGHMMDFESKCPHCNEENTYGMDLRVMLDQLKCPDYDQTHTIDFFMIKFRPQAYFGQNKANKVNFEIQKLSQMIENMDSGDERTEQVTSSMNRLVELNLDVLAECTEYISPLEDPTNVITDKAYILEFYKNVDAKLITHIQEQFATVVATGNIPPQRVACMECSGVIDMAVIFDYSNFFVNGS